MTTNTPDPAWATSTGLVQVKALQADSDARRGLDRVLIGERIHRYGWGYDERQREQLADCFTEDGVWEGSIMGGDQVGPYEGRDTIVSFLTDFWAIQTDQRRHIFTNVVVDDLTSTSAVAHAYLMLTAASNATMTPITTGPYRLAMRKEAHGVWRIGRLSAGFDAPF